MQTVKLNNGSNIPAIGFGVFLIPDDLSFGETLLNAYKIHD